MFGLRKAKADPIRELIVTWKPHEYTPDYAWLETRENQLVFLYNEIMTGNRKHAEFINGSTIALGTAFTQAHDLFMFVKKLGNESFPIVMEGKRDVGREYITSSRAIKDMPVSMKEEAQLGRIKGELYAFKPNRVKELDKYLRNGVEFERKRVKTVIFYYKLDKESNDYKRAAYIVRAWMYLGIPEYWEPLLDAGFMFDKGRRFAPPNVYNNLSDYYYYGASDK